MWLPQSPENGKGSVKHTITVVVVPTGMKTRCFPAHFDCFLSQAQVVQHDLASGYLGKPCDFCFLACSLGKALFLVTKLPHTCPTGQWSPLPPLQDFSQVPPPQLDFLAFFIRSQPFSFWLTFIPLCPLIFFSWKQIFFINYVLTKISPAIAVFIYLFTDTWLAYMKEVFCNVCFSIFVFWEIDIW